MSANVCVVLSGCGVYDGAEIHEAVISLLALSRAGANVTVAAPNKAQHHVVNHLTGEVEEDHSRNVLVEAARIARGEISDLADINAEDYDALFLPGGFGAAKNLSSFAFEGSAGSIDATVRSCIQAFHNAGKPIGAVCISPALVALALGKGTLTIGSDEGTAAALESLGASHSVCSVTNAVVDSENKLVTAPAYMENASIAQVADGINAAVSAVLELC